MNSNGRSRVIRALEHQPGAFPIDFGATPVSGMHVSVVDGLRRHYGLASEPVKVIEPYQMLGEIDGELKKALGIDTEGVPGPSTLFGFRNTDWKEWRTPWGQDVLVPGGFQVRKRGTDILIFPEGDTSADASGRMPGNGYFFDSIIRQKPIDEDSLTVEDNLEEFGELEPKDVDYYARETARARSTGRAVVAAMPGTGLGDIALVPAPFLKHPRGIRDVEEWYVSLVARTDFVHEVFDRQTDIALKNLERIRQATGTAIDVAFICGTDFGTQTSSFCSVEMFNELYAPYYRKINGWIHQHTDWKTFKHTCGAVEPFLPSMIDVGFDIINPVQCSAAGMVPATLKEQYGDRLTFWGGGVDTQKTLPFGTAEDVRSEVRSRCEVFSPGGGFVFNAIHNVVARSPIENVVAMMETAKEVRD